jgi:hypothetical protein
VPRIGMTPCVGEPFLHDPERPDLLVGTQASTGRCRARPRGAVGGQHVDATPQRADRTAPPWGAKEGEDRVALPPRRRRGLLQSRQRQAMSAPASSIGVRRHAEEVLRQAIVDRGRRVRARRRQRGRPRRSGSPARADEQHGVRDQHEIRRATCSARRQGEDRATSPNRAMRRSTATGQVLAAPPVAVTRRSPRRQFRSACGTVRSSTNVVRSCADTS